MVNETTQGQGARAEFDDEIDLRQLLGILLDGRYIIAASVALFAAAAVAYALLATPIYRANGIILVEDNAPGVPGLDDMAEIFASESSSATELHVIKSRMVVGQVVDELDLTTSAKPIYFPVIGAAMARRYSGVKPVNAAFWLDGYAWGGEHIKVSYLDVPRGYLGETLELVALGGDRYLLSLGDRELLKGSIGQPAFGLDGELEIVVDSLTARTGTRFEVIKSGRLYTVLELQRTLSVSEKGKDTGIIEIALEGPDRDYIAEVVDSTAANYYFQNVKRLAAEAESSLDFLDQQIPRVKADLALSEEALNDYRSERTSVDLSLEAQAALDSLVQIEADISAMSISEADISRRFTPEHPNYISFKRQQENLQQQRDKLSGKLEQLPDTQKRILRLKRDFEVNQAIFIALENRRQELSILKASTVGNVRLLDSAEVMPNTVAPKRALIAVLGTLLGGMFGLVVVAMRSFLKAGITDPKIFSDMGLMVHATIPYSDSELAVRPTDTPFRRLRSKEKIKKQQKYNLLAHDHPADLAIEALRSLRTSLHFSMMDSKNNLVMISSASPGVGKSFVSVNLAAVVAQSGRRVLIIDADMRKGYQHRRFDIGPENGLAEVLAGTLGVTEAIRGTPVEGLDFLSRGKIPSNPSELLMGPGFTKLVESLADTYDLVLFDTPPILAVTDASIIGAYCGSSIMVSRFESCTAKEIAAANSRFELNGIDIKGIVFNAVQKKAGSYYYDYGYYNYEYKSDEK